jgi:hypothetical protein
MGLTYLILAHRLPEQLGRLVGALSEPEVTFITHVDAKVDLKPFAEAVGRAAPADCVTFVDQRERVNWGGFSTVRATLRLMAAATASTGCTGYVILLSGQDYPIKSRASIKAFLARRNSAAFLDCRRLPYAGWEGGGLKRVERWYFRDWPYHRLLERWTRRILPHRRPPRGLRMYGGSAWWCLSLDCARHVVEYSRSHRGTERFFEHALLSDEMFFQTVVMNSPFSRAVENDNLHYIDWRGADRSHPALLRAEDFEILVASPKLFARKFDASVDERILDMLDEHSRCSP